MDLLPHPHLVLPRNEMDLRSATEKTKKYFKYFDYEPNQAEIDYWLIGTKITKNSKKPKITNRWAIEKIILAQKMSERLKFFPGIKMIAITGSVAANNCKEEDDIDIMIVTAKNALWVVRPLFLILLSLFFIRRKRGNNHHLKDQFCLNLWLDESAITLAKEKRNLYTAHEVLQIIPLLNKDKTYEKFITKNSWTKEYFATAYHFTTKNLCLPREAPAKCGHCEKRSDAAIYINYYFTKSATLYFSNTLLSSSVSLSINPTWPQPWLAGHPSQSTGATSRPRWSNAPPIT